MKIIRLSLLMVALVMCVVVVPEAFGGSEGGALKPSGGSNQAAAEYCDYYIYCYDGRTACCYGSFDYCLGYCEGYCGGHCEYNET